MADRKKDAERMSDQGAHPIYDSVEEAEQAAAAEAEAAGVTPSAVMKSAREGYGSGAKDTPRAE